MMSKIFLNTAERTLTHDLLSVAVADHEFGEEGQKTILEICGTEGISLVELVDSIREKESWGRAVHQNVMSKLHLTELSS